MNTEWAQVDSFHPPRPLLGWRVGSGKREGGTEGGRMRGLARELGKMRGRGGREGGIEGTRQRWKEGKREVNKKYL